MSVDPKRLDLLESVVGEIVRKIGIEPHRIMVIGAEARDLMHSGQGHDFDLRGTTDVDLALVLDDWSAFDRMQSCFPKLGSNGIRFRVSGVAVDVMPFGGVEDPTGLTTPASRGEELVVFGFQDVYACARPLELPSGRVRLPSVPGYAALKLRAWIDRSPWGEDKDARDLAAVMFWYQRDPAVEARVWLPEAEELLLARDTDIDRYKAYLLGADAGAVLSAANRRDLADRLIAADPVEPRALDFGRPSSWTADPLRRSVLFDEVIRGVAMSEPV
ncbi:hypothetical protein [Curtobacterium sp. Leaf261]|uniref:hypothetical protein n=1 Tax=Curtobacterium sp. Leaf261 TaxID=1736311 RepID=UPI0006F21319|nr:hypothetical protein [Curtobacterium sp. Leaf261]KQO59752.1 hypothetical protein ASF23_15810 [Curtobacterium sp. Leaf261]